MRKPLFVSVLTVVWKIVLGNRLDDMLTVFQSNLSGNITWRPNVKRFHSGLETELFSNIQRLSAFNDSDHSSCYDQLYQIASSVKNNEIWALKFLDAWGKFPSGVFWGNLMEYGNFDECLSLDHQYDSSGHKQFINGKYCIASIPLSAFLKNVSDTRLKIGICIPRSCDAVFFNTILANTLLTTFNITVPSNMIAPEKCTTSEKVVLEEIDWIAISIFSFIGLLIISSTIYEIFTMQPAKVNPNSTQVLCAFSIRTNLNTLFRIVPRKSSSSIGCLDGIRCLSIIWVIFGHSYMFNILQPSINQITILNWAQTPFSMFLQSGTFSVDSFFFLSGLLLAWVAMKNIERNNGKLNIWLMYLHRYVRLTPVILLTMLFFVSIYRYIGNGPLWKDFTSTYTLCHDNWWATLLYVQNYAAAGRMCLGHTWYLAVDMQLYILSPLILIPLYKWKNKAAAGVVVLGLLMVACVFTSIIINKFVVFNKTGNLGADTREMRKIYYATHARTSSWLVGILCGYFLYKNRDRNIRMTNTIAIAGWLVSLALFATMIFALYPKTQPDAKELSTVEGAFYLTLGRVAWPLALSWVVFACYYGYGGFANIFLSWSYWQPMARLSYSMYIIHLLVESINTGRNKVNIHFSDYDTILRFWGDFGITILASLAIYVAVESPLTALAGFFFKSRKEKTQKNTTLSKLSLCGNES